LDSRDLIYQGELRPGDQVLPERDLKLGVLTALVGAPLFLHLIYKTRRDMP